MRVISNFYSLISLMFCLRVGGRENFFHCYKCGKLYLHLSFFFRNLYHIILVMNYEYDQLCCLCVLFSSFLLKLMLCSIEGCCYTSLLKNSHPCVEGAMHHDCPVCFEVRLAILYGGRSYVGRALLKPDDGKS